jgi:pimeloyl-ACP methyl ester carboxylesterase
MAEMVLPELKSLTREDGETIAYLQRGGKTPVVLWLGGFKSDMQATKAQALARWAERTDRAFLRFDYFGHGASSGDFRKGTIGRWRDDALAVIDTLAKADLVLVGSSMGGWIALLAGLARPERIKAMLLIAPAVDFTEALLWPRLPKDARQRILEHGEWLRPSAYDPEPYPITKGLIDDGRRHLLLDSRLKFPFPVRILQGMKDPDVPWQHAAKVAEAMEGDVTLTLARNGDHRLSTPADLRRMRRSLEELMA